MARGKQVAPKAKVLNEAALRATRSRRRSSSRFPVSRSSSVRGAITKMTDDAVNHEIPYFSSGAPSLDIALGIGGFPRGRVVEIYGPESSGKTTLTLHAIAEVQKTGGVAAFIDAEHALDVN